MSSRIFYKPTALDKICNGNKLLKWPGNCCNFYFDTFLLHLALRFFFLWFSLFCKRSVPYHQNLISKYLNCPPSPTPYLPSLRMGCLPITNKSSYLAAWIKIFQGGGWQCKSKVSCPRTQHYVSSKKSHLLNSTLKTMGQRISHITLWLKVLTHLTPKSD